MKNNLTTFQLILFVFIVFMIVASVLTFAFKRTSSSSQLVPITLWGTLPAEFINSYQRVINEKVQDSVEIIYTEFSEADFEDELISALASGKGPDSVIFSEDLIVKQEDKLFTIPYDFYSQSDFKNNFIEAGEVLLKKDGILGVPLTIDPLVLYWNRTILNNNGMSQPPTTWAEFLNIVPKLTQSDSSANISKSAVSLGEFRNIKNAKEIFATLVGQAGNPIIARDNTTGEFASVFDERYGYRITPADAAINFYTQFSNPSKDTYTWNRSLPEADEMFLSGDLAFYIGFASERNSLVQRNPNLNFGIAQLPQSSSSGKKYTGGQMYFLGILNRSQNISAAYSALVTLTSSENMIYVYDLINLPPVRRDLLVEVPSIDYRDVFNKSSLITNVFLDPDRKGTQELFQEAIESVISGRLSVAEALVKVDQDLNLLIFN